MWTLYVIAAFGLVYGMACYMKECLQFIQKKKMMDEFSHHIAQDMPGSKNLRWGSQSRPHSRCK